MASPKIRADFEQLENISKKWDSLAESVIFTYENLRNRMSVLRGGDWIGSAADKFYEEMDSMVLPAIQRLFTSFNQASQTTLDISRIMMEAEFSSEWQPFYASQSQYPDWFYAMGGFTYAQAGVVTVIPPSDPNGKPVVRIDYVTRVKDYYNWDQGKSTTFLNPTNISLPVPARYEPFIHQEGSNIRIEDRALAELHRAGIAQEYEIQGQTSVQSLYYFYTPSTSKDAPKLESIPEQTR